MSPKKENDVFVENSYKEYFAADLVTFPVRVIGKRSAFLEDYLWNGFSRKLLLSLTSNRNFPIFGKMANTLVVGFKFKGSL